ncbi:hypothetical protein P280DRAFT_466062 [Massarina eburnea CBS 473.64]|uniref:Uncharacterized protein n=1 Tax=Massarina eburnea CBS 473.64 TaxID=1395130 RepID=A0A6A6SEE8_9PLEO|nr:hypothetical protein P280DRAFT_466062 [Massarina eburnea CBS 473.64]
MSKNLISLPPLKPWSSEPSKANTPEEIQPTAQLQRKRGQRTQTVRRLPFCSNPSFKSTVADPAVTRTDVHVVAIAPCWNWEDGVDEGGIDAATPTMQMVESKSGCFEVVWDDVPIETDGRVRRRSSSASQALHTIGSTASRGLERVNSKLTEWTFGNRVVVFPDDDSCNDPSTYSLDSEEKAAVVPPPNSERTSAAQSRLPSRSTSVRQSRSVSNDDSNPKVVSPEDPDSWHKKVTSPEVVVTLAVPDPESLPPSLTSNGQRTSQAATLRRLSNIEDSEMKFRGHRDSVTLAHNRVPRTGGVSPELFMHRDSVSMAKKRMHARNHAVSEARIIPRRAPASAEPFLPDQDCSESIDMPLPPTVKEHATEALHSSISASMLRPQPTGSKRHIRIVE